MVVEWLKYNKTVSLITIFSVLCFITLNVGFIKGVISVLNPEKSSIISNKTNETIETSEKKLYVALGDSLSRGVGDKEGQGYPERVKSILENEYNQDIVLSNLAISGATTSDLLNQLKEESVINTIKKSDAVFLTIGGNDLFPSANEYSQEWLASYKPDEKTFQKNIIEIVTKIKKVNKNVSIYTFGYYNPFHNVSGSELSSSFVIKWNNILENSLIDSPNTYFIPTYDIFYNQESSYLYTDHFHPNAEGYTQMANRLGTKIGSQLGGK